MKLTISFPKIFDIFAYIHTNVNLLFMFSYPNSAIESLLLSIHGRSVYFFMRKYIFPALPKKNVEGLNKKRLFN